MTYFHMMLCNIDPIENLSGAEIEFTKHLILDSFKSPNLGALLDVLLERKFRSGGSISNFLKPNGKQFCLSDAKELRRLFTASIRNEDQFFAASTIFSVVYKDGRPWSVVIILFCVHKDFHGKGVGSQMLSEMMSWMSKEFSSVHLIILSASSPNRRDNWWIRQFEEKELPFEVLDSLRSVQERFKNFHVPGLWSPWVLEKDNGRHSGVHLLVTTINNVQPTITPTSSPKKNPSPQTIKRQKLGPRRLHMAELCAGSARLSKQFLNRQCAVLVVETDEKMLEFDHVFSKENKACTFHSDVMTLDDEYLKNVDYVHLAPPCRSISQLAQGTHQRNEDNDFYGETTEADVYNRMLHKMADLVTMMKNRDSSFAFTLEQPYSHAVMHNNIIKHRFEHESSPIHCKRVMFDWCKVAGMPVRKKTILWIHNLPPLVSAFQTSGGDHFICDQYRPCHSFAVYGKHADTVRGNTAKFCPYPDDLVTIWASTVTSYLSFKRVGQECLPCDPPSKPNKITITKRRQCATPGCTLADHHDGTHSTEVDLVRRGI